MLGKYRKYLRVLKQNEKVSLNKKYSRKISRQGFLKTGDKKLLLREIKLNEINDKEIYDKFYNIRERTVEGLRDLNLICESLTEEQLDEIFSRKDGGQFPVTRFLLSLLPSKKNIRDNKSDDEKIKEEWRKNVLFDVVNQALEWYSTSGFIKTEVDKRTINDCRDILANSSSNETKSPYRLAIDHRLPF